MRNPFCEHPASVGESYFRHLCAATGLGLRMIGGGITCLVHGLLPFAFVGTGGDVIKSLSDEIGSRRKTMATLRQSHGADH